MIRFNLQFLSYIGRANFKSQQVMWFCKPEAINNLQPINVITLGHYWESDQ